MAEDMTTPDATNENQQCADACRAAADACTQHADVCEDPESSPDDLKASAATCVPLLETALESCREMAGAEPASTPDPEAPVDGAAAAAGRTLLAMTGKASYAAALRDVESWKAAHAERASERKRIAEEQAKLDANERKSLVIELVTLGAEDPATAWEPDADGLPDGETPAEPWASMPLERLRARVEQRRAAAGTSSQRPAARRAAPKEPAKAGSSDISERELAKCKERGIDPAAYAKTKAAIAARSRGAHKEN